MANLSKLLFWLILFLLVYLAQIPSVISQSLSADIDVKIVSREFTDAYVVGDSFYYELNVNNSGNASINDTFKIYILNSHEKVIENIREYNVSLKPNEALKIVAKGGKEGETAAFPFEMAGDYRLIMNSTQPIDFYRRFFVKDRNSYVRQFPAFNYFFDVMPRWQYVLWKQTSEANDKIITANEKLLSLTNEMRDATNKMKVATDTIKVATIVMLILTIINLASTLYPNFIKDLLKALFYLIILLIVLIIIIIIIGIIINFNKE